jgi:hypothetical protein
VVAVGRLQDFLGVQVAAVQQVIRAALELQGKEIMEGGLVAVLSPAEEVVVLARLAAQEAHQPVVAA